MKKFILTSSLLLIQLMGANSEAFIRCTKNSDNTSYCCRPNHVGMQCCTYSATGEPLSCRTENNVNGLSQLGLLQTSLSTEPIADSNSDSNLICRDVNHINGGIGTISVVIPASSEVNTLAEIRMQNRISGAFMIMGQFQVTRHSYQTRNPNENVYTWFGDNLQTFNLRLGQPSLLSAKFANGSILSNLEMNCQ